MKITGECQIDGKQVRPIMICLYYTGLKKVKENREQCSNCAYYISSDKEARRRQ